MKGIAVFLLAIGLAVFLTGAGLLRMVPTFPDVSFRVGWRRRLGFDPGTSRAQRTVLLIGAGVFMAGLISLVIAVS